MRFDSSLSRKDWTPSVQSPRSSASRQHQSFATLLVCNACCRTRCSVGRLRLHLHRSISVESRLSATYQDLEYGSHDGNSVSVHGSSAVTVRVWYVARGALAYWPVVVPNQSIRNVRCECDHFFLEFIWRGHLGSKALSRLSQRDVSPSRSNGSTHDD
jgi:hypothetical protein